MAAALDGRVEATGAVFEAKFMLPWSFSEEAAAEKYMPQLQHNMWVVAARTAVLSMITGGGKWVEITTHADPLYQHLEAIGHGVRAKSKSGAVSFGPRLGRMDSVRLASMCHQRDGDTTSHGRSTDLCAPLWFVHAGREQDDLDAPDLIDPTAGGEKSKLTSEKNGSRQKHWDRRTGPKNGGAPSLQPALSAALSASLKDELLREIENLNVPDEAAAWAHRRLRAKQIICR
jgi:hypothetical protein